jgi:cytochrome oxidase Cu insertion factor (SCO1/SenC/PrrC family)
MRDRHFTSFLIFVVLIACAPLAACAPDGPKFQSSDVTGATFGRDFHLTDANGKPRTLADYRGKAVVIFFGYTQCPDVCPTTLAELAEVMKRLGPDADRVQVLFVTVDPQRDTPELLSKYVPAFDPRFAGLYGDAAARNARRRNSRSSTRSSRAQRPAPTRWTTPRDVHLRSARPAAAVRELRPESDVFAHDLRELLKGS